MCAQTRADARGEPLCVERLRWGVACGGLLRVERRRRTAACGGQVPVARRRRAARPQFPIRRGLPRSPASAPPGRQSAARKTSPANRGFVESVCKRRHMARKAFARPKNYSPAGKDLYVFWVNYVHRCWGKVIAPVPYPPSRQGGTRLRWPKTTNLGNRHENTA